MTEKGFELESATVGTSYLNKYLNDKMYIYISDMDGSVDFVESNEVYVSLNDTETDNPIGIDVDSKDPFMQSICSDILEVLSCIDDLMAFAAKREADLL